jgi:hypothetical protein
MRRRLMTSFSKRQGAGVVPCFRLRLRLAVKLKRWIHHLNQEITVGRAVRLLQLVNQQSAAQFGFEPCALGRHDFTSV